MEALRATYNILRKHLEKHIKLTNTEFAQCTSFFTPKKVRKGQFLLQEGEVSKHLAFIASGSLRSYTIDAKGEEHIDELGCEGWWITDLYSFLSGKPTTYFIDALADSELLLIDVESYNALFDAIPKFDRYVRIILQNNLIAAHGRIIATIGLSAEDRYKRLLETRPTVTEHVALRHIASYLGITPEALSRIRNRMAKEVSRSKK